jgi:hypothetical protein
MVLDVKWVECNINTNLQNILLTRVPCQEQSVEKNPILAHCCGLCLPVAAVVSSSCLQEHSVENEGRFACCCTANNVDISIVFSNGHWNGI